jgi:hypothetical protein
MTTTPNTTPDSLRSCPPAARRARVERKTKESDIVVELDLDGTGRISIDTGVPFFDHMLTALGTHASFDLTVTARGDVEIEGHQRQAALFSFEGAKARLTTRHRSQVVVVEHANHGRGSFGDRRDLVPGLG